MTDNPIPSFAVVGHPNEGKSSVVATLTENDRIRVSETPGETVKATYYPIEIDGREIMRFVDTPGFQHPGKIKAWFEDYTGPENEVVAAFVDAQADNPTFRHDVELLRPLIDGSGMIYVVDGSRPVRHEDRAEMEILRRTGLPRLAIINQKQDERDYTEDWKNAFRRNFNSVRVFNAHRASYAERLGLLQTLRGIDQDWEPALNRVMESFTQDWSRRLSEAASDITEHLERVVRQQTVKKFFERTTEQDKEEVLAVYQKEIIEMEKALFRKLRKLYRHQLFKEDLPADSILNLEIFCDETVQVLGLSGKQLTLALASMGAGGGAWLDTALGGLTFGIFTATGAVAGTASALLYGKHLARVEVSSPISLPGRSKKKLGGIKLSVGPNKNPNFFTVMLNRSLIYFAYLITWTHARRDTVAPSEISKKANTVDKAREWTPKQKQIIDVFFKALHKGSIEKQDKAAAEFTEMIMRVLEGFCGHT